jgi:hypothetical protein
MRNMPWLGLLLLSVVAGCPGDIDRSVPVPRADAGDEAGSLWYPDTLPGPGDGGQADPGSTSQPDTSPPPDTVPHDTVPCSSYAEKLDKKDNNCNGKIDEGYWAKTQNATYTALSAKQPLCTASKAFSDVCTSGAHRLCTSQGYVGGFGPVEYGASHGVVVCLADALATSAPISSLTAKHASCTASTAFSLWCNSAIHRTCAAMSGYVSGVGPVEHSATVSHFICVKHAKVYQVSFATLASHHSGCKASSSFKPDCQAAINRYCAAKGHVTGFGPVEQSTNAWVVCLDAK